MHLLRQSALPLLVLLIALAATAAVAYSLKSQAERDAAADFEADAHQVAEALTDRMRANEDTLRAVGALFATMSVVTRDDWRRFVDRLSPLGDDSDLDMLGFGKRFGPRELTALERQMQAQDLPDFRVWPDGARDEYLSVTFIEPFSSATRPLLGYDLLTNAQSRSAIDRATRTGGVSVSSRWTVQGDVPQSQATVLMFAPVYPRDTENGPANGQQILGYVFAALQCDDLMDEVLHDSVANIGLAVYDEARASADSRLYANARARAVIGARSKPAFDTAIPVTVGGREWTLHFFSEPYAKAVPGSQAAIVALAAGIPLSFLLFGTVWSQTTLRARAVRIAEDMTQSLRAQAGLLDLTHDGVLLRDRHDVIRYWNRGASDLYGYSAAEAIGRTVEELLHTRFPEPRDEIWREIEATGRWNGELVHTRRDGTEIIVASRWAAQRDAHGAIEAILETNNDVSEHRREQEERRRLEASLLQASKLEAMGTLAGGIAHDFNNILGAILGYGELAQNEARPDGALRRYLDNIMSAGLRAKSLVARILAFSRSGLGQRLPVHVQSIVAEALDLLSASLPKDVQLERELAADDAAVVGDPTQIHQVVLNLSTNALQAMKQGGTLRVTLDLVTVQAPLTLVASTLAAGEYVRLSVSDTGVGIEPGLRDRIFDPFFTTKGVGVGTGLGLSLVHGIATDLGGGVDMRSEVGVGTTFDVYLPRSAHAARVDQESTALPNGNGETVMIVDDEEVLVRLGEEMLAKLGYEPVGYTSAGDALAAFRSTPQRFDLVLSDEMMPGMTGSELAAQIRALDANVPIVLMSGYAVGALAVRAVEVGAVYVLNKPLVTHDIARALDAALHQRAPR
jgi:PAS domain S-box-containing protein